MRGFLSLTHAHAREFFRVRQEVFLAFALPVLFMVVLGGMLSNVPDIGSVTNEALGLTVGVADAERLAHGEDLIEAIERVPTLHVVRTTAAGGLSRLETGELAALLRAPEAAEQAGEIVVLYNSTRTQRSRVILNRLHGIAAELNTRALGRPLPVRLTVQPVGGEDDYSSYVQFFVPGVVAMTVFPGIVFSLAPTLVVQRERGLLRRLWLTPASMAAYGLSHLLFRLALALGQTVLLLGTAALVFHPPFHYGVARLLMLCTLGALTGTATAFLIAAIANSQAAAITLTQVTMIPMLLACGAFFPLELMPSTALPIIQALPLTPLAASLRGVLNFDYAVSELIRPGGILLAYTVVCAVLAQRLFRWDSRH